MLKNYLTIAWRNLWKNRAFSAINISGLALGLACSIFIFLWVRDEYSVDAFHTNGSRLYTVVSREYMDNKVTGSYDTPGMLGEEMKRVMPEVEYACSYAYNHYYTFSNGEKKLKLNGNFAGTDFFKMFSYPLLEGTATGSLQAIHSIAISRKMANNFFGGPAAAINQTLRFENYRDLKVSAVFEDLPNNVSERFDYLLSWNFFIEREDWVKDWHNSGPVTFVQLRSNAKPSVVNAKLQHFIQKYDKAYTQTDRLELALQRYDERYLHSNFRNGLIAGGRIEYVKLFSLVAIFILLIACINFMNLSTARSLKRSKEIGVRKVIGAIRSSLVLQFLGEALFFSTLAVMVALLIVALLLPAFNTLTGKQIEHPGNRYQFWLIIAGLTILTGCLAGSYPALLLSSFKPIAVLKNKLSLPHSSRWLRKGLVVFQFALSIIFITGMMVISEQVNYIQQKNLGYQRNNLVYLPITGALATQFDLFKNEALKLPGIAGITRMSNRPLQIENTTGGVDWDGKPPGSNPNFTQVAAGYDFIITMQAEMVTGRDFSPAYADSNSYIINEAAVARIGYADPIGRSLTFWGRKGTIAGVVKNFHFNSLHVPIAPIIIRLAKQAGGGYALVRMAPGKTQTGLAELEKLHQELNPAFPFSHQFADEEYLLLYKGEMVVQQLSRYFASLAIFISSLGLLGLVLFTVEQRTREIGIRKVLGASVGSLFQLVSKDFLALVFLALLIATPLSWWAMSNWLRAYEYRISIRWSVFAVAGSAAMLIALVTVAFQAMKAARSNPVDSLREA